MSGAPNTSGAVAPCGGGHPPVPPEMSALHSSPANLTPPVHVAGMVHTDSAAPSALLGSYEAGSNVVPTGGDFSPATLFDWGNLSRIEDRELWRLRRKGWSFDMIAARFDRQRRYAFGRIARHALTLTGAR